MACGRIVYLGEADKAIDHFAELVYEIQTEFGKL